MAEEQLPSWPSRRIGARSEEIALRPASSTIRSSCLEITEARTTIAGSNSARDRLRGTRPSAGRNRPAPRRSSVPWDQVVGAGAAGRDDLDAEPFRLQRLDHAARRAAAAATRGCERRGRARRRSGLRNRRLRGTSVFGAGHSLSEGHRIGGAAHPTAPIPTSTRSGRRGSSPRVRGLASRATCRGWSTATVTVARRAVRASAASPTGSNDLVGDENVADAAVGHRHRPPPRSRRSPAGSVLELDPRQLDALVRLHVGAERLRPFRRTARPSGRRLRLTAAAVDDQRRGRQIPTATPAAAEGVEAMPVASELRTDGPQDQLADADAGPAAEGEDDGAADVAASRAASVELGAALLGGLTSGVSTTRLDQRHRDAVGGALWRSEWPIPPGRACWRCRSALPARLRGRRSRPSRRSCPRRAPSSRPARPPPRSGTEHIDFESRRQSSGSPRT